MMLNDARKMALIAALMVGAAGPAAAASVTRDAEVLAGPCAFCHGPGGVSPGDIPSIAGRDSDELRDRMLAFRAEGGDRGNDDAGATIMPRLMRGYSPEDIDQLADYFAGLPQ